MEASDHALPPEEAPSTPDDQAVEGESAANNRKQYDDFSTPQWSFHLGGFIFAPSLISLRNSMEEEFDQSICQWATQTLLGAANLEQTKLQNGFDI